MRSLRPDNELIEPRMGDGLRLAVGEAPDQHSLDHHEPFAAGYANWLRGAKSADGKRHGGFYYKAGVKDKDVTYLNVLQCKPPTVGGKDTFPTDPEARAYMSRETGQEVVAHCVRNHVMPVLRSRPWERIDLFGDHALEALTGRKEGVWKWRGSPMQVLEMGEELLAIPTIHPKDVAVQQEFIPVVINDLKKSLLIPPEYYNTYPSLEEVQEFKAKTFVFDIEVPKWRELGELAPIEMVGLCDRPYHAMVVPMHGAYKQELKRIFMEAEEIIGHNIVMYDIPKLFGALGIEWKG